jgi:hypothetical protein
MFRSVLFALACMVALGAPASSSAQAVPPETVTEIDPIDIPPARDPLRHAFRQPGDRGGFYLRASTTLGYHRTRLGPAPWENEFENVTARGFGTAFGLDLGGFVKPWLALHVDLTTSQLWNGEIDRDDLDFAGAPHPKARIVAYGAAPAATFVTPHDFYFKTAFGVGFANIKRAGRSDHTNPGFYMDLVAGKDLYVNENFSFGIQMQIIYMLLGNETKANEARVQQYLWGFSVSFDSI